MTIPLTPEDVADIVAILDASTYQTLDIKTARFRLRVARDGEGWAQEWDWQDETSAPHHTSPVAVSLAGDAGDANAICAPLPGTFYRAPQPGAPSFVEAGDEVTPETVVGIIETMKLMNPVYAGVSGAIAQVFAENGAMVGKGDALMRIA
jgi:acetyl-CoA carboxylase biotin carboxyl carrier protein